MGISREIGNIFGHEKMIIDTLKKWQSITIKYEMKDSVKKKKRRNNLSKMEEANYTK